MSPSDRDKKTSIKLFEDYKVRTSWDKEKETWYFSVVDIVAILTESIIRGNHLQHLQVLLLYCIDI